MRGRRYERRVRRAGSGARDARRRSVEVQPRGALFKSQPSGQILPGVFIRSGERSLTRLGPPIHEVAWAPHRHDARLTARIHPPDTPILMALVDATNVVATDAPSNVPSKPMISDSATNAPNAEKLGAALDDVASFNAAERDTAAAKLDAASAKDAPGLCIALLRVASDGTAPSARRLAAGTFARNLLRKAFWTADPKEGGGASFPDASRASVRVASLDALCAAPDGPSRALLANFLRLAGTAPCASTPRLASHPRRRTTHARPSRTTCAIASTPTTSRRHPRNSLQGSSSRRTSRCVRFSTSGTRPWRGSRLPRRWRGCAIRSAYDEE